MKKTTLIVLLLFASFLISVPGTWAETRYYEDYEQNSVTKKGVLGVAFCGDEGHAIHGFVGANPTGLTSAGFFENQSPHGIGVIGNVNSHSGGTFGGSFVNWSSEGIGVRSASYASTGYTYGGWFRDTSTTGTAVHGEATATSDRVTYGGHFESASTQGIGVYGFTKSKTGKTYGGHFLSDSTRTGQRSTVRRGR